MKYEYLTGPLCKKIDNISKEIKASSQKNKKIIKFGRGGKGREVDEYMNLNRVTSTEHISFGFDDNDNFFAKDLNSKHGSYLLLKNRSQVYDKLWSNIKPLFKTLETPEYPQCSTLYICNSCFYFELYKPSDSHN
jgi:pSer/pThr/pTyr-binding forkhead associated (FHA) protein